MLQANLISTNADLAKCGPTLCRSESANVRSSLASLPQELGKIEQDLVAGRCGNREALEAVIRAIASVEQITAVDVALGTACDFTSVASEGLYRVAGAAIHFEIYAACVASGRLIRCAHSAGEPRAAGLPCASFMIMPLMAHGAVIGVLAVFSTDVNVFGHEHILPFGTAAAICSAIAPRVFESESAPRAESQPASDDSSAHQTSELPVRKNIHDLERETPSGLHVLSNPAPVRPTGDIAGTAGPTIDADRTSPILRLSSDARTAERQAQDKAIRALVRAKPPLGLAELPGHPAIIDRAFGRVRRRRLSLVPVLLLLSGMVFGGIHMLRRETVTVAHSVPKTSPRMSGSLTIITSIGDPRPLRGIMVAVDAQITKGRLIQDVLPQYSWDALGRAVPKEVTAILFVSSNGIVEDVRVADGDRWLSNNVTSALSHWRFTPFQVNGRSIPVEVPVTLEFQIDSGTAPPTT